ncbi:MAG TPA: enoyl-CoA hydratase/isomerase family protein [Casimicrobiaceae bacterium]|nr:enoyl-CoA hydratase/isomerase family protein [Casimicrobiaceae bacterium]
MNSSFSEIQYDVRGSAAWIVLDRPREMNAMTSVMLDGIARALDAAAGDASVRAVVITGNGDTAFCAGADLKQVLAPGTPGEPDFLDRAAATLGRLRDFPKPAIAAVNGLTLAGGLELVLCCDLVVAADHARMGDAHANFGVFPGAGGAAVLPRRLGPTRAKYLLYTGEQVSAVQMCEWGLVNEVVPGAELHARVAALAEKIASKSPLVLRQMKRVADAALDLPRDAALANELLTLRTHLRSHDLQEGLAAFREKRPPRFAGR